jgi:hypothetical protein
MNETQKYIDECEKEFDQWLQSNMKKISKKEQMAVAGMIYQRSLEMAFRGVARAKEIGYFNKMTDDDLLLVFIIKSDAYKNLLYRFLKESTVPSRKMHPILQSAGKGIADDYLKPNLEDWWKDNEKTIYKVFDKILGHEWYPFIQRGTY